ncbi:MAG: 2-octaprenyl-6-methoxyphenyl hydroxylase [Gammaproteobacteria bacterium]|nr:2-octaprenyl-6-methoxyphenyl hydroxylase [Gammaproteobacteria bacterium]
MADATDYDLLIVGGGMVGASLALALTDSSLRIGIVEAVPHTSDSQPSYDDRAIALAYGSRVILESLGVWQKLAENVAPIKAIHISDRGHFGTARLHHKKERVDALGYVATSRTIGAAIADHLEQAPNVELLCPARLKRINFSNSCVHIDIEESLGEGRDESTIRTVSARLLVGADGGRSLVREQLAIGAQRQDYQQSAIITNVTPTLAGNNVAFERFTDSGPLAMLPMPGNRYSVVWTVKSSQLADIMALNDVAFLSRLQKKFGYRLGTLKKVGARNAYPLALVRADERVRPRMVLVGNAVHTLHPVAGQGFNLGLRDAIVLAQVLRKGVEEDSDIGDIQLLNRYDKLRSTDQRFVTAVTDATVRLFSNNFPPLVLLRNLGLLTLDALPQLKHSFARRAMGLVYSRS